MAMAQNSGQSAKAGPTGPTRIKRIREFFNYPLQSLGIRNPKSFELPDGRGSVVLERMGDGEIYLSYGTPETKTSEKHPLRVLHFSKSEGDKIGRFFRTNWEVTLSDDAEETMRHIPREQLLRQSYAHQQEDGGSIQKLMIAPGLRIKSDTVPASAEEIREFLHDLHTVAKKSLALIKYISANPELQLH